MSEEFNDFFGMIIIIAFVILFWNALSADMTKQNATPQTQSTPSTQVQSPAATEPVSVPAQSNGVNAEGGGILYSQYIPANSQ